MKFTCLRHVNSMRQFKVTLFVPARKTEALKAPATKIGLFK